MSKEQRIAVAKKCGDALEKAKRHQENLNSKFQKKEPIKYKYKVMKTQHIKDILGIILIGVTTICIILITFIYWQRTDIGKYEHSFNSRGLSILDTKTGKITLVGETRRIKVYPFEKNLSRVWELTPISSKEDD